MGASERAESACPVCGGHEIEMDQVSDAGRWLLASCGRCDHRWTSRDVTAARDLRRVGPGWATQDELVAA